MGVGFYEGWGVGAEEWNLVIVLPPLFCFRASDIRTVGGRKYESRRILSYDYIYIYIWCSNLSIRIFQFR